ncbi:hypothetical protein OK016_12595 [Vibrio chagasii]|nr:hypothetical protein [Vibrio chagasii]
MSIQNMFGSQQLHGFQAEVGVADAIDSEKGTRSGDYGKEDGDRPKFGWCCVSSNVCTRA